MKSSFLFCVGSITKNAMTAKEKNTSISLVTPIGRLSYPHLFAKNDGGNFPSNKYETTFLIPKTMDVSQITDAIDLVLNSSFGGKITDVSKLKYPPFRDGDEKGGDYAGHWYFKAKSENKPKVVGPDPKELVEDPERVFGGANARLSIQVFSYDNRGSKGVSIGLGNVQVVGGGEKMGGTGSSDPTKEFSVHDNDDINF